MRIDRSKARVESNGDSVEGESESDRNLNGGLSICDVIVTQSHLRDDVR